MWGYTTKISLLFVQYLHRRTRIALVKSPTSPPWLSLWLCDSHTEKWQWGKLTHDTLALRKPSLPTLNTEVPWASLQAGCLPALSTSRVAWGGQWTPMFLSGDLPGGPLGTPLLARQGSWRLPQCLTHNVPGASYWYLTLMYLTRKFFLLLFYVLKLHISVIFFKNM